MPRLDHGVPRRSSFCEACEPYMTSQSPELPGLFAHACNAGKLPSKVGIYPQGYKARQPLVHDGRHVPSPDVAVFLTRHPIHDLVRCSRAAVAQALQGFV